MTGAFIYDAESATVLDWSITVSGGDEVVFAPFTYTPATSAVQLLKLTLFRFIGPALPPPEDFRNREIRFASRHRSLRGGVIDLDPFGSVECNNCVPWRPLTGRVSFVPELPPAMLVGFGYGRGNRSKALAAPSLICVAAVVRTDR